MSPYPTDESVVTAQYKESIYRYPMSRSKYPCLVTQVSGWKFSNLAAKYQKQADKWTPTQTVKKNPINLKILYFMLK